MAAAHERRKKEGFFNAFYQSVIIMLHDGSLVMTPWLLEKMQANPDMVLHSQDGKPTYTESWDTRLRRAMNYNHPDVIEYVHGFARKLAEETALWNPRFFLFAQEGHNAFRVVDGKQKVKRCLGYNPTGKRAFQGYLEKRYGDIAKLNAAVANRSRRLRRH